MEVLGWGSPMWRCRAGARRRGGFAGPPLPAPAAATAGGAASSGLPRTIARAAAWHCGAGRLRGRKGNAFWNYLVFLAADLGLRRGEKAADVQAVHAVLQCPCACPVVVVR